jgi:hypothetical protein
MNLFLASRLWSDVSDPHPARPTPRDPVLSLNANHNLEWLRNLTPIASQYTRYPYLYRATANSYSYCAGSRVPMSRTNSKRHITHNTHDVCSTADTSL